MRRVPAIAVLLVGLTGVSCRNAGNHELLERELRWQEDKISQLESELQQARDQLRDRCPEAGIILPDSGELRPMRIAPSRGRRAAPADAGRSPTPPEVDLPSGEGAPPYQGPPVIQPPDPNVPEGELPNRAAPRPIEPEPAVPEPAPLEPATRPANLPKSPATRDRAEQLAPPPGAATGSGDVNEIVLDRELTGRRAAGGAAGEDSVVVVVEPRNSEGQLVKAAGAISIVVLDLSKDGPEARIARWDFPADKTAQYQRDWRQGGGMRFQLRWPGTPPRGNGLQLFVRLTTHDGRKLVADTELTALPDNPGSLETSQTGDPAAPSIRLVSDAETLPQAKWRRSRRPLPRAEELEPRVETSLAGAAESLPISEAPRQPGEPRRLPDDVLNGNAAAPLGAADAPRDDRAWAPYR